MFNRIKEWIMEIIKSRLFVTVIAFCVLFAILILRDFYLQIVKESLDLIAAETG